MLSLSKLKPGTTVFLRDQVLSVEREYEFHSYEPSKVRGGNGKVWLFNRDDVGMNGPSDNGLCYLTPREFKQRGRLA